MSFKRTAYTGLTAATLIAATSGAFAANDMSSDSMAQKNGQTKAMQSNAQNRAQGLYSTSQLMDASVYLQGDQKKSVGEISNVLLDNNMTVKSFVIETSGRMGLGGGKSYVVDPSSIEVQTKDTNHASKPEYTVTLAMTKDQLSQQPVYSDSWWSNAQTQATGAWQDTKQTAHSAWTEIKSTTSNIVNGGQNKAQQAGNAAANTADNATDATQNAASNAANATQNAASNATQNAASNAANSTQNAASTAANKTQNAASTAANKTQNAASSAANKAGNAANNATDNN